MLENTEQAPQPTSVAERAQALCDFLADLQRLRVTPTRSLESYRSVIWYADLPDDPAVAWPEGDEPDDTSAWLAVDRVERTEPPSPPTVVTPWITEADLWNFREPAPALRETVRFPEEVLDDAGERTVVQVERRREDVPEIDARARHCSTSPMTVRATSCPASTSSRSPTTLARCSPTLMRSAAPCSTRPEPRTAR